jgi:hypothetical protein
MRLKSGSKIWIGRALDNGGRPDSPQDPVKFDKNGNPLKPYLGNGTLLEHYGDVLYKLGEKEEAVQYWIDAKKAGDASGLIDKKIADKKLYE